jgi:hypothetical protein
LLSVIESDFFIDVNVFYAHNKVYLMSTGKSRAVSELVSMDSRAVMENRLRLEIENFRS